MKTNLKNIETVKFNDYEIAKTDDVDGGITSFLNHLDVFTSYFISGHKPVIKDYADTTTQVTPLWRYYHRVVAFEKNLQDFVIGGGLEQASDENGTCLRLLPIVAFSKESGLFISNGKDEEGKDIMVDLDYDGVSRYATQKFYELYNGMLPPKEDRIFRMVSVYIGDGGVEEVNDEHGIRKKNHRWTSYDMQWRISANSEDGTSMKNVPKKQTPIVKLYTYAGDCVDNILDAKAKETPPEDPVWRRRIKIAEVLTCFGMDAERSTYMEVIRKEDIHFVTATQYWEGIKESTDEDYHERLNENLKKCKETDWKHGIPKCPYEAKDLRFRFVTADVEKRKKEVETIEKNKKDWDAFEEKKAFNAEHYNYRWTADHTRTYSLLSTAEFNEMYRSIHRNNGKLKYGVVDRDNIFLEEDTTDFGKILEHQLRGEHIHIKRKSKDGKEWTIRLQLDNNSSENSITEFDYIDIGFEKVGKALRRVDNITKINDGNIHKLKDAIENEAEERNEADKKIYNKILEEKEERNEADKRIENKLNEHVNKKEGVHGATSEAEKNHIALRDNYGCFKVTVPKYIDYITELPGNPTMQLETPLEYVINIEYLNSRLLAFKKELALEMLTTKLVSCQREFDDWANYTGAGRSYKVVYLQGTFTWDGDCINLDRIGTETVIGIVDRRNKYPVIRIRKDKRHDGVGILGTEKWPSNSFASISNVTLYVDGYSKDKLVGFRNCVCTACNVVVTGEDGYKYKESFDIKTDEYHYNGIDVTGFSDCHCTDCKATVKGGDGYSGLRKTDKMLARGGNAVAFHDSMLTDCEGKAEGGKGGDGSDGGKSLGGIVYDGERGGDGGHGGDAQVFSSCTLKGNNKEKAIGGNGGNAGNGGDGMGYNRKSGDGGYGGDGGSVYVYKQENGTVGKGGRRGVTGAVFDGATPREDGGDGDNGFMIIIS